MAVSKEQQAVVEKLSEVEKTFIEAKRSTQTVQKIAETLKIKVKDVKTFISTLPKVRKVAKFETPSDYATSMTGAQSSDDDENALKPRNEAFFEKHKNHIHKIRPDEDTF